MFKKLLSLTLLVGLLNITSCNLWKDYQKDNINIDEKEVDKEGIPKNLSVKKWYQFRKKLNNIAKEYYSVQTEIVATTFRLIDNEWEEIISKQKDDEPTPYWNNKQKIQNYLQLQKEYSQLPLISEKQYENEIKLIFKTMQFWIIYKHLPGVNGKKFEQVFHIDTSWKEDKKRIYTRDVVINEIFNTNWEYKIRKIDPNGSEKWIEIYNQETQIKLFEYIQFNKYVESLYEKYGQEDEIDYHQKAYFSKLSHYEEYINMEMYEEWIQRNKKKSGFGVWKEIG